MKIKNLVIAREMWGTEYLLNDRGHLPTMCCLGFLALACGAAPDEIDNEGDPADVPNIDWPKEFIRCGRGSRYGTGTVTIYASKLAERAININDDPFMTQAEKEKRLISLFKRAGIRLSFVGESKKDSF